MDLLEVQKILGHGSILTTVRYTHITQRRTDSTEQRINELMNQVQVGWGKVL